MKKLFESGLVYKTSRMSYVQNYFLVALLVALSLQLLPKLNPDSQVYLIFLGGMILLVAWFLEEPEIERMMRQYHVTNGEVMMMEGILSKKRRVITYSNVSNIDVIKSVVGRILNYGDIHIVGPDPSIKINMKGIRHPDELYRIINNKVSKIVGHRRKGEEEKE